MKILVINAGSSSLKYQLIDMENEEVLAKGNCERIGMDNGIFSHKTTDGREKHLTVNMSNHTAAFMQVKDALVDSEVGVIKELSEVSAIGHRIVQGGAIFSKSVLVDEEVIKGIESLIPLAPLHNSAHVQGIRACRDVFGTDVPEVVVFDTAFHSTMPPKAYMFAVPYEYYEKYKIRRYGFHGTSHRYVSHKCAQLMGKPLEDIKMITCHLGNGSSITAIQDGKVLDTSMGLTPLDGFMMGTRSGTLDPSVVTFIAEKENLNAKQLSDLFNKKSGLLGISGVSSDDRDVTKAAAEGNPRAILAHEMLVYQIKKFIGSYAAAMDGCDAIVFTAGLGENQEHHRQKICDGLTYLGVKVDPHLNHKMLHGNGGKISTPDSRVEVYVIPTNEELVIARDTKEIVENL
ncbi:MAG TPA: acetate kinase [Oscillospiraceae bacterium]|nr:acetate kinase [Oscillospiraceae bacterium]